VINKLILGFCLGYPHMTVQSEMKTIAYIAPEIPALSATFVYNEVLGLEGKGFDVVPISVHVPSTLVKEDRVAALASRVHYLYAESILSLLLANVIILFCTPLNFIKILFTVLGDVLRVGLSNRIGLGLLYRFFVASRVAVILKNNKCFHLHAHFAHVPTDIAMYAALLADIPFSFTSHANDLFERGWLLPQKITRSQFAVTISEFNKEYLCSLGGDGEKIHVVRCGVNSDTFAARPFNPCTPPYTIGTLGRMVEKKGFDILLRAAMILHENNVEFELLIAGSGPLEDYLKKLSQQLALDRVVYFVGSLPHKDVPPWLKTLDLFVLPCQKDKNGDMDGIPVVLMEAMLSGIPVVSTKLSGIPELIGHGKEGILAEPKSPESLASAIWRLLDDDALQCKCVGSGVEKVEKEFDAESNIKKIIKLFEKGT